MESAITDLLNPFDAECVARTYRDQGQIVYLESALRQDTLARALGECRSLRSRARRRWFPGVRRGGAIGYQALQELAPSIVNLYRSPAFVRFVGQIVGRDLLLKSERDGLACAVYWYRRQGDHMRAHFDHCGCSEEASITILCGLVDDCTNHLEYQVKGEHGMLLSPKLLAIEPGAMLIFNGSRVLHGVTPLGENEERAVLALSYTSQAVMPWSHRLHQNIKDALVYFGLPGILQRNYFEVLRGPGDTDSSGASRSSEH